MCVIKIVSNFLKFLIRTLAILCVVEIKGFSEIKFLYVIHFFLNIGNATGSFRYWLILTLAYTYTVMIQHFYIFTKKTISSRGG